MRQGKKAMGFAALGVVLVAAPLIALWPALAVSPKAPADAAQPFSVPFQITNAGYLPLEDVTVYFYVHRVDAGGLIATRNLMANRNWRAARLGRGESITIDPSLIQAPMVPGDADIVIVAHYKVWGLPFLTQRHFVRFVGEFGTRWQWLQQPGNEVQAAAESMIANITFR